MARLQNRAEGTKYSCVVRFENSFIKSYINTDMLTLAESFVMDNKIPLLHLD